MRHAGQWVLFFLDSGRYALPLMAVDRVVRAVHITPLPGAPANVLGAVDVAGQVLPVFNLRRRFGLRERPLRASDHFLIARAADRLVILLIDSAGGLIEADSHAVVEADRITEGLPNIRGVIVRTDGLVLIHDLDQFLSAAEARALDGAMAREARHGA
jgi:purine-binding chemotaxis protein CheW